MARIKIEIPIQKIATVQIKVRITDINYGSHLGNDALVGILHEARLQWLQHFNYTELNIQGVGLIMSDLAVEYKNESFYGDDLTIALFVGEVTAVSFELYYSVANQSDKVIAKAKTGMVCYSYVQKKVTTMPNELAKLLAIG